MPPNNTPTVTLNRTGAGPFTLTATISNPCSPNGILITKTISTGTTNINGYYNSPASSAAPINNYFPPATVFNNSCVAFATNFSVPAYTTVTWTRSADPGVTFVSSGGNNSFCNFTAIGQTAFLTAHVTNSCATQTYYYAFKCTTMGYCGVTPLSVGGGEVMLAPNPANSNLQVSLSKTDDNSTNKGIYEIQVVDKSGNTRQTVKYGKNHQNINLDVSRLKPDVYTIRIFDGEIWRSEKFIKL